MNQEHPDYVTITHGMRGFFAVYMMWNEDLGGFYEHYETGIGSYKTSSDAVPEAMQWAQAERVKFKR